MHCCGPHLFWDWCILENSCVGHQVFTTTFNSNFRPADHRLRTIIHYPFFRFQLRPFRPFRFSAHSDFSTYSDFPPTPVFCPFRFFRPCGKGGICGTGGICGKGRMGEVGRKIGRGGMVGIESGKIGMSGICRILDMYETK